MALTPLATPDDLRAAGVAVSEDEEPLVAHWLAVASAAVREAAGCPISETISTVDIEGEAGVWLHLPGPPVTAVAAVAVDEVPVTDWRLRSNSLWRRSGWHGGDPPAEVTVTYTHGLPDVPADIIELVCRIAAAALVAWRSAPDGGGLAAGDVRSERLGDYSVTYGSDGLVTEMELPDYLRERLAARFGGGAALVRFR
ncbi:hypothetical protein RM844_28710 [Streptomyces sp. DSM 44915]|uniref:Head-to-tail adaptor n=1 Tax=Streptomyces chisholmiae TaxID=3075540 RepID=A0ABU2K0F6_9ACTN|nr:hypothetical protein [Streptomyces sp. DSM 44915]MDT0270259.1 hypothetical protein [Streptomyces sp. DSM 44915]